MSFLDTSVDWRVRRAWRFGVASMILHSMAVFSLYSLSVPSHHKWFWLCVVAYYWFFYWRMIVFGAWTSDTLRLIASASSNGPMAQLCHLGPVREWPEFIVLIPAYAAGRCIQTVATVLNEQDYPRERWKAIFVSDELEHTSAVRRANAIAKDIQDSVRQSTVPKTICVLDAALLLFVGDNARSAAIEYIRLFGLTRKEVAQNWATLLTRLVVTGISPGSDLPTAAQDLLRVLANETARSNAAISANIADMLGIERCDLSLGLDEQIWAVGGVPRGFQRSLEAAVEQYSDERPDLHLRSRLLSHNCLGLIAAAHRKLNPCSSQAIDATLARIGSPNLIHWRRPPGKRNKASALNFGFEQAAGNGWLSPNTYIMVLDCDSFLPTTALSLSAIEIMTDPEPNVIRQLLPITTTNFSGRNWVVRTIIAADSLASPGRWARNVRTQTRSDLTAGSGVVIPASFLKYLALTYGEAWNSSIICEDARMIISQYAILDGVTKRTKMIPSYVLEGAPEQDTAWRTYVAFWRQRLRWALGGMDEVAALLRVPVCRLLIDSSDFKPLPAGHWSALMASLRRLHLLLSWLREHLWWSGMALAPALWLIAEIRCGAPPLGTRVVGFLCIFIVPSGLLQFLFKRRVAPLVPGGVSQKDLLGLLATLILAALPFVLPVVVAQFVCLVGQRRRLSKWNPATPKPGSQFGLGAEGGQILLVTPEEGAQE